MSLKSIITAAKDAKIRVQSELDATSLRNRTIKSDLAYLLELHHLELAVEAQVAEAERLKRAARKALPMANAALRTAFRVPDEFAGEAEAWGEFERTVWRRS